MSHINIRLYYPETDKISTLLHPLISFTEPLFVCVCAPSTSNLGCIQYKGLGAALEEKGHLLADTKHLGISIHLDQSNSLAVVLDN